MTETQDIFLTAEGNILLSSITLPVSCNQQLHSSEPNSNTVKKELS